MFNRSTKSGRKKSIFKKIAIISAIVIIVLIASAVVYYFIYQYYDEKVSVRITEDVIAINDMHSTVYLIKTDSSYIVIDAGYFTGIIRKGLEYNSIDPKKISAILLTHTDFDHQEAISLFPNATVYFSQAEYDMVKNNIDRLSYIPWLTNSIHFKKFVLKNDADKFVIGKRKIKCISLPGHTQGSMGFIIDNKYLFSGDAFRIKNGKIQLPFRKWFTMDVETEKKSLRKVAQLKGIKYIFSGHSGFTADFDFAISDWIERR